MKREEIYVGSTNNIEKRLVQHNGGAEISTRRYMPWNLVYYEAYMNESHARMRERRLKYNGNAMREVKKRIGLIDADLPRTTFTQYLKGAGFTSDTISPQPERASRLSLGRSREEISKSGAGFTMIELLVTVSIFALVSSVLLASYPKFSSRILLENTAHLIGLSVRQAQTYGLNVRGVRFEGLDVFPTFGMHFGIEGALTAYDRSDNRHFVLFADTYTNPPDGDEDSTNNDKMYNAVTSCDAGDECVDVFAIQSAERIVTLCGTDPDGEDCSLLTLDVAYTRPNPDASIRGRTTIEGASELFSSGRIIVQSPRGDQKSIVVQSTGQITVE